MRSTINEQAWHRITEAITSGMREWRAQHPKATLRAMEDELDARWARVRTRCWKIWPWQVLPPIGVRRQTFSIPPVRTVASPRSCAEPARARSKRTAARSCSWNAAMARIRPVAPGFFPLDDELALLPGNLTPRLQESLVRLTTHIPSFAKASPGVRLVDRRPRPSRYSATPHRSGGRHARGPRDGRSRPHPARASRPPVHL